MIGAALAAGRGAAHDQAGMEPDAEAFTKIISDGLERIESSIASASKG